MNAPALACLAGRPEVSHAEMANAIRFLAVDAVEKARSGHPGMPMGMADVATVLFSRFLKFDAADPAWPDRDRFVLSAGHGSMLLYALLHLTGYEGMTSDELKAFRQWGSKTPGHPEYGHTPGVETTTGPLGQGLATAVGMALAERLLNARFGNDLVDHHTYVIAGDGCLMEGLSHEAISLAGHLGLSRLIVLFDDNEISIDGATSLSCSDDQIARFRASGWSACRIDGHDPEAIAAAIERARHNDRPSLIACRTVIGFGAPSRQGTEKIHGAPLGAEETAKTRAALDWPHPPFVIPGSVAEQWRSIGTRGQVARHNWIERTRRLNAAPRSPFHDALNRKLPCAYAEAMTQLRDRFLTEQPGIATRQASQQVIDTIAKTLPNLLGGSADLTHSNLTRASSQAAVRPDFLAGNYIHYGVREHAMAAAMNGIALHGGFIPYGGTFLAFADYSRPAIRLAALMGIRVIHVMTHDFHRVGRGRSDPSAGRASGVVAGDSEPAGISARRRGRDRRGLGLRAAGRGQPFGAVPVAAGLAGLPCRGRRRQSGRARRLSGGRTAGWSRRHLDCHRLRSVDRARGGKASVGGQCPRRRGLGAVLRSVPPAAARVSRAGAGQRSTNRRRGGARR